MVKSIMTKKHNGLYKKLEHFSGKKGIIVTIQPETKGKNHEFYVFSG